MMIFLFIFLGAVILLTIGMLIMCGKSGNSKCIIDSSKSFCAMSISENVCNSLSTCKWDSQNNKCVPNQEICTVYKDNKNNCEQHPLCKWTE